MCRILLLCGFLVTACSSKTAEQSPTTGQASSEASKLETKVTDDATVTDAVSTAPTITEATAVKPKPSRTPECLEACGDLLNEPFESLADKVNQDCNRDWRDNSRDLQCKHWDLLRNCVYAAGGKAFKKERWRGLFREYSWYKINPKFKHENLGAVAKANIKLLKEQKLSCEEFQITKPGEPVKELAVDLDGDGTKELIRVTTSRIFVDGQEFLHQLKPYSPDEMEVKVRDVDPSDSYKEVMVAIYYYEQNAHRRFLYKRADGVKLSERFTWHDGMEQANAKKGTIKLYSGECGQDRTEVYGFKKEAFAMLSKKVKGRFREEMCSACPYVYVWEHGRWVFEGEILRNLRSMDLESTHQLRLGLRPAGQVRIRLAERKDEVTFVDGLELVAVYSDGREEVIVAEECKTSAKTYCTIDQSRQRIEQGEQIELSFELPEPATVHLRARGYYLPL